MQAHRPLSLCPFCEHRSPSGSKFCNQCGAALHLQPCRHCGALNDVTQTRECARCHQDLGPLEPEPLQADPPVSGALSPRPALPLVSELVVDRDWRLAGEPSSASTRGPRWPWLLAPGLLLAGLSAWAGYRLALHQAAAQPPAPAVLSAGPAASAPGALAPPTPTPTLNTSVEPVRASAPPTLPAPAAVAATASSAPPPAAAGAVLRNPPRPAVVAPPAALPGRAASAAACSEAMAALGLCAYRGDSPSPSSPRSP
ncbi:MAG: zinc ribbon domain-containing protein [Roseateles asaccharophilus]|uniref:Double zinc ribbon protein n=1 Tax=Roseateles asaccharophilus TaxID=582607 RepID=A0A4R6NCM2_9BURK|nr:zinc ribbon domain-containing protein [Roseateles asaccharophilus]TDP12755.1 double zinc ribbon protein [Roseateles asaccharophilus]